MVRTKKIDFGVRKSRTRSKECIANYCRRQLTSQDGHNVRGLNGHERAEWHFSGPGFQAYSTECLIITHLTGIRVYVDLIRILTRDMQTDCYVCGRFAKDVH